MYKCLSISMCTTFIQKSMEIRRGCWVPWNWSYMWATMWMLGTRLGLKYWANSPVLRHLFRLILLTHEIDVCPCLCMYRDGCVCVCVQACICRGQRLMLASIVLHLTLLKESFSLNQEFIGWLDRLANKIVSSSCPQAHAGIMGIGSHASLFTRVLYGSKLRSLCFLCSLSHLPSLHGRF